MSSSSNVRISSHTEQQTTDDKSNLPSKQRHGRRGDHSPRRQRSPKPATFATNHRRTASSSQAMNQGVSIEERRTERAQITTKKIMTSRTRSPGRRLEPSSVQQPERQKVSEATRAYLGVPPTQVNKPGVPQQLWNPEASLKAHTTAPLASRMSMQLLASQAPESLQPIPLKELSVEVQEAAILEDLLFVLMGYEGQYIRFSKHYHPSVETQRLAGPSFRILTGLDPALQDLTISILKIATYYGAIQAFVEVQSREEFGSVNHALCAAIRKLLHDYLVLIVQLEKQFLTNSSFTLHTLNVYTLSAGHTMFQIYSLAHEILRHNTSMEEDGEEDGEEDLDLGAQFDDIENFFGNIPGKNICKGGTILGLITKRLEKMSGDPSTKSLLTSLLGYASRPYMTMLNEWLHHGSIQDPHDEFLIREQKSIGLERLEEDYTDEYWDRRYTLRHSNIPPQLEGVKSKVLLAGKYLNVVRACGGVDVRVVKDVPRSFGDVRFLDNINNAYALANESLLKLLLTNFALPARLRSLKHYFFLDRSDFISHFLELGTSELRKPVDDVNTSKLQSLLDLVIRQPGSVASRDPFKENVKVEMNKISLVKSLTRVINISGIESDEAFLNPTLQSTETEKANGFDSLQLDYSVPFPVSLVISRKTIWRYQALFRYLLSLRYLEQQLVSSWQTQNRGATWSHKSSRKEVEILKRSVFTLRARMLHFVQQLFYFCTSEVIEPNWQALMEKLEGKEDENGGSKPVVSTVEELMRHHVDFLDTCLKECVLTNGKLLKIHSKLVYTCFLFASSTAWFSRGLEDNDPDFSTTGRPANMNKQQWARFQSEKHRRASAASSNNGSKRDETPFGKMEEVAMKCGFNFSRHLQILLDALNHYAATETVVFLGLCARLSTANQGTELSGVSKPGEEVIS